MAHEFKPGQIVPESGIYSITHDPQHADMPHEVAVIKGRLFPTCRHCKGIAFELVHAAKAFDIAGAGGASNLLPASTSAAGWSVGKTQNSQDC
jgi:hypothetical protein